MKLTQTLCSVLVKSHSGHPFIVSVSLGQQVPVSSSMASSQNIARECSGIGACSIYNK